MASKHRLPTHVRPARYEPQLRVALDEDTFEGHLTIELDVDEPCRSIELHARDLEPEAVELDTGEAVLEPEIEPVEEAERWVLSLPEAIEPGPARLSIRYRGRLGEAMTGLYRSTDGEDECLVTQCEPTHARSVFPCFDEPGFKAPIAWHVRADSDLQVLANGPQAEVREHEDGTSTRVFEPTPPISTYLAAVAVGDFEATAPRQQHGVDFRVWALDEAQQLGSHARDRAAELLDWFEAYFEQPYPYAKYDQLAVPSFSFGAMENVGLVVFREPLLLLDRDRATWDERKAVDRVVAHELAHMWFGNLVTMRWWDDLWLNEAFAEWIAHEALDQVEPEHQVWHAFRQRTDQALATDALDATHPIYHPVQTPAEAMEMFDAITYGKGSAVMRMLAGYLGPESFREGLASYIETFVEDNATGQQLWDHLAQASEEPVTDVMRAWITQPGHPCVDVDLLEETDGLALVELAQQRHRARRSSTLQAATWPVPVVLRYADRAGIHRTEVLLEAGTQRVELEVEGELAWLLANADQEGFYRARHDEELRSRLLANARELTPAERWGLLRDSFSLVKAGRQATVDHLELLDELATGQAHFAFVDDLIGHVRDLERLLEAHGDEAALAGLRAWTRSTLGSAFEELGAEGSGGEGPARRHRRATVLAGLAGIGGHEQALDDARAIAAREREDPDGLEPETATAAVRVAARRGEAELFDEYAETYRERRARDRPPQQVERYLHSLPLFRPEAAVEALLGMIEEERIPAQSIGPLLERMLQEPHAQSQAVAFLEANLDALQERVGTAWIARIAEALGHAGPDTRERALALLEDELAHRAPESTKRALERIEQSSELAEAGVVDELARWARAKAP